MAPERARVLRLNATMLRDLLGRAPMEFTPAARATELIVTIPMPDGSLQRFRVEESPMLSPQVAAQVPDWKTYAGRGIDDPTAVVRFSWSKAGFSAAVLGAGGASYVDPAAKGDREHYVAFHRDDLTAEPRAFHCELDEYLARTGAPAMAQTSEPARVDAPKFAVGATLKTYRLAIAATGEYTVDRGGQDAAFADVMKAVNRFNLVFRRDASISFTLVSGTNTIFPDPNTDPYNNTPQLDVNQQQLDTIIGSANYDIGHLFGTGGGGLALSPSVCAAEHKAKGYSSRQPPTGDPFWVDYVAHEIGHQFGAQHTYNNAEASTCSTRSTNNAYEVASGATIMSYVGICGERNLQRFSIDMFHVRSLTQILAEVARAEGGGSCGTSTGLSNTPPTPNAGANYTIPKETPFTLTASATDPNAGDALTYSWEQYDLAQEPSGPNGNPPGTFDVDSDGVLRPLFRVYAPSTSPARTYPSLPYILNNANVPPQTFTGTSPTGAVCKSGETCVTGETLPATARTMNFRVVVRDNNGGSADAGMLVTVDGNSGPFAVTAPNGGGTLNGAQTVGWTVSNTNAAPINAANVKITLSTDGGQTFPIVLAESTPNTGSANVTLPNNISTTTARVKIEAIGNIFFDISDANFTVVASETCPAVSEISPKIGANGDTVTITGVNFTNGGVVTGVRFSNNATATFTVVSDTTITATVPAGAVSGPITISKTGCPDAQTTNFTVCPSAAGELKVDDGQLNSSSSSSAGAGFVNRLTPSSYPATLTQVLIFWDPFLNVTPGTAINVLAGANPSGGADINGITTQSFAATAGTQGYSTYTLPNPITITSGDFIVGYTMPNDAAAVAIDTDNPANRSYFFGGSTFTPASGNYMIRASVFADCAVDAPPGPAPSPTPVVSPTPAVSPSPSPSATPTVQFDASSYNVKEDTGEATLTVTRTGDTSGTTTVNYATGDGTAKAGEDYTAESGTITFAPGETSKEITIAVSNDPSDEPAESFSTTLTADEPQARGRSAQAAAGSSSTTITIVDDDEPTTLGNIATRMRVETGENALIGGIIITGTEPKKIIVRAVGPSLGLEGRLEDPQLQLFDANENEIAFNNNWKDAANQQEIIDSTVAPTNDLEPAILISLAPGNYTAVVRGVNNTTGIGVAEIYDLDREADSKLANISTRGFVRTEPNVMIGGFIVLGATPQKVIIRAIGPSLTLDGKLDDPTLDLVDKDGNVIRANNNWKESQQSDIEATGIPPRDERESAVVEVLSPGQYTAVVRGVNDTTGVAVVEVYALN